MLHMIKINQDHNYCVFKGKTAVHCFDQYTAVVWLLDAGHLGEYGSVFGVADGLVEVACEIDERHAFGG